MWESLATSRRSDRVLHGAAKLLNVVVGVIALPIWLLGQRLRDPLRRLLARLDADPAPSETAATRAPLVSTKHASRSWQVEPVRRWDVPVV